MSNLSVSICVEALSLHPLHVGGVNKPLGNGSIEQSPENSTYLAAADEGALKHLLDTANSRHFEN
jgi:hypothetical protein